MNIYYSYDVVMRKIKSIENQLYMNIDVVMMGLFFLPDVNKTSPLVVYI
jgi:hypothetical protein